MPTLTIKFDGTLKPLLDYLRYLDGCYGRAANKERLLLKVGRQFVSGASPPYLKVVAC